MSQSQKTVCAGRIHGEQLAARVAAALVRSSQWFEFTPLPDGVYEFVVKIENQDLLPRLCAESHPGLSPEEAKLI